CAKDGRFSYGDFDFW
nr:immunoglobulin heavy chain junction region [Macaca mulatta]MOV39331.1 immunoglobulin heavy chain junction region [Macaca mulatta]MOV39446.1 immunoglobulin heavy chain junction region [Macaca mulatta]MOV39965.1 immunoglobulin heavy chain junction region [Macaca mulatta]MOV40163.1 immunoglobulin heavy chain junction region [Macaca mulatta]